MRVAVYSPVRRQGATTISILLGATMARQRSFSTCLTYTGTEVDSLNLYLSMQQKEDMTKSLSQMVKLLEADIISNEDVKDYLYAIDTNLDLMHTANEYTNKGDSERLLSFILDNLPHDLIITDVNSEPYEATTQKVLEEADLIAVVISQSMDVVRKLQRWRESEYFPDPAKVVYVINEYDSNVSAARDVANKIGVKYTKVSKVSMNPYIRKMSNSGKLIELLTYIIKKDIRVIELNTDLRDLCYLVAGNLGVKINWR